MMLTLLIWNLLLSEAARSFIHGRKSTARMDMRFTMNTATKPIVEEGKGA
jgi:hypothetical protein